MRPALLFLVAISCAAQVSPPLSSQSGLPLTGPSDGRLWKSIPEAGKIFWLKAYHEGLKTALLASVSSAPDAANRRGQYASRIREVYPEPHSLREVSSDLDQFYKTPENGQIEISMALTIIAMSGRT